MPWVAWLQGTYSQGAIADPACAIALTVRGSLACLLDATNRRIRATARLRAGEVTARSVQWLASAWLVLKTKQPPVTTPARIVSLQTIHVADLEPIVGGVRWSEVGRAAAGGAIAGGLGGLAAGAIFGPGVLVGGAAGFVGGAITTGTYNIGQQLGLWDQWDGAPNQERHAVHPKRRG